MTRYSASPTALSYVSTIDPAAIEALRQQGLSYSEIGEQLGSTKDTVRGVHRRWRSRNGLDVPGPGDAAAVHAASGGSQAGDRGDASHLYAGGLRDSGDEGRRPRAGSSRSSALSVKSEIELARATIAKVTRAEITLKYRILADRELNEVLAQRLMEFDRAVQNGVIPTLAMRLVDEAD